MLKPLRLQHTALMNPGSANPTCFEVTELCASNMRSPPSSWTSYLFHAKSCAAGCVDVGMLVGCCWMQRLVGVAVLVFWRVGVLARFCVGQIGGGAAWGPQDVTGCTGSGCTCETTWVFRIFGCSLAQIRVRAGGFPDFCGRVVF